MTKYIVYVEGEKRPVRKIKREYEALDFITDVKNLAQYGCMTLVMDSDDGKFVWDMDAKAWVVMNDGGE